MPTLSWNYPAGPVAIYVDGIEVGRGSGAATGFVTFTPGVHAVRVQSVGGWFAIKGATLGWTTEWPTP